MYPEAADSIAVGSRAYPKRKKTVILIFIDINRGSVFSTIRMEGSPLVLKLKGVEMSQLYVTRQRVLLGQLLASLERIGWPHLHTA